MTKQDEIQRQAVIAWASKMYKGTIEAVTGIGKTWVMIRAIVYIHTKYVIKLNVLHLAERTNRKEGFLEELAKYSKLFSKDFSSICTIEFATYQAACKWSNKSFDLVLADEIHDSLSEVYSRFYFKNSYKSILGASATIDRDVEYRNKEGDLLFTKGMLLDKVAPVCFTYSIPDGQKDDTVRNIDLHVIYANLGVKDKTIEAGNKSNVFYQTEQSAYVYLTKKIKEEITAKRRPFRFTTKRKKILTVLKSKETYLKRLVDLFTKTEVKTLVFAHSIELLEKYVKTISYKNKKEYTSLMSDFNSGKFNIIGSYKMLKQGVNIPGLDCIILHSYDSKEKNFIQSIGRLRKNQDKKGIVIVFVTKHTKELDWFDSMIKSSGIVPKFYNDISAFINYYKLNY